MKDYSKYRTKVNRQWIKTKRGWRWSRRCVHGLHWIK